MTNELNIQKENLLKAHKEGCSDVKKVLENLFPDAFKPKDTGITLKSDMDYPSAMTAMRERYPGTFEVRIDGKYMNRAIYLGSDGDFKLINDNDDCLVLVPECNLLPEDR